MKTVRLNEKVYKLLQGYKEEVKAKSMDKAVKLLLQNLILDFEIINNVRF